MNQASFWLAALERAVKSAAQTIVVLWTADEGLDIFKVSWDETAGLSLGAFALSVATSVASSGVGGTGPSLGPEVTKP